MMTHIPRRPWNDRSLGSFTYIYEMEVFRLCTIPRYQEQRLSEGHSSVGQPSGAYQKSPWTVRRATSRQALGSDFDNIVGAQLSNLQPADQSYSG